MQNSYIGDYINLMLASQTSIGEIKNEIFLYKACSDQLGSEILAEAISRVRKIRKKDSLSDLDIFVKYKNDVILIGLAKKYKVTKKVAQTILDLKIPISKMAPLLAKIILDFDLKSNQNAIELSSIICQKNLEKNPDAVMLAVIILNHHLRDDPRAVKIATMMLKLGITLDLAIDVCRYDDGNYSFKQLDEKYVFHKLRQIYQVKMKMEPWLDFENEIERIAKILNLDYNDLQTEYMLLSCMGNNWGRNGTYYWDYGRFIEDVSSDHKYTDEDIVYIKEYVNEPRINGFARGFNIQGDEIYFNGHSHKAAPTDNEIISRIKQNYLPLYKIINKYSLPRDVIVFRGTDIASLSRYGIRLDDSAEDIKRKLGGHYQDGGFMSTSAVAEDNTFMFGSEVNFIINLKTGTPCGELSQYTRDTRYESECEVLIPPNVVFIVNDVRVTDERIYIYLTSIPTKSISYFSSTKEENTDSQTKK